MNTIPPNGSPLLAGLAIDHHGWRHAKEEELRSHPHAGISPDTGGCAGEAVRSTFSGLDCLRAR